MRVFFSDLHLQRQASTQFMTFAAALAVESRRAEAIYLLGDVCEAWVGDDDDGELAAALRGILTGATRHCPVYVMHGNRDFLLGSRFMAQTGCTALEDPHLLADGTLLSHGDKFCVDDRAYQELRMLLRSETWQQEILAQPLEDRRQLASQLRAGSDAATANKAENIMDVTAEEVAKVVASFAARTLIHGHTHRPGIHQHDWGPRVVLGAWEHCGWLARADAAALSLECFPLTGRYET